MKTYDQFINEAHIETDSHARLQYYPHLRTWMVISGAVYRDKTWKVSQGNTIDIKRNNTLKVIREIAEIIAAIEKISIDRDTGEIKTFKGLGNGDKGKKFTLKGWYKEDIIVKSDIIDEIFNKTIHELNIPNDKAHIVKNSSFSTPSWEFTGTLDENKERWEKFLEILKYKYRSNLVVKKYNL